MYMCGRVYWEGAGGWRSVIYGPGSLSLVIFIVVDRVDVSPIYQQLLLDQELTMYLTVNQTSFWYSLSSCYFSTIDTIFQDIPQVIFFIGTILVTRADDEDHLQNLAEFLKHLQLHGYQNKIEQI